MTIVEIAPQVNIIFVYVFSNRYQLAILDLMYKPKPLTISIFKISKWCSWYISKTLFQICCGYLSRLRVTPAFHGTYFEKPWNRLTRFSILQSRRTITQSPHVWTKSRFHNSLDRFRIKFTILSYTSHWKQQIIKKVIAVTSIGKIPNTIFAQIADRWYCKILMRTFRPRGSPKRTSQRQNEAEIRTRSSRARSGPNPALDTGDDPNNRKVYC